MPAQFGLKIEGLDELVKDSKRAGGIFPQKMYEGMVYATTNIQNSAKEVRPGRFKNQTGNLRRSIFRRVESPSRGVVGVGEQYGEYVEFGTRPHVIVPKTKKMLAFKVNGQTVFAKRVNHPGSKPYPYMEPALRENSQKIVDNYGRIALEVLETMGGKR